MVNTSLFSSFSSWRTKVVSGHSSELHWDCGKLYKKKCESKGNRHTVSLASFTLRKESKFQKGHSVHWPDTSCTLVPKNSLEPRGKSVCICPRRVSPALSEHERRELFQEARSALSTQQVCFVYSEALCGSQKRRQEISSAQTRCAAGNRENLAAFRPKEFSPVIGIFHSASHNRRKYISSLMLLFSRDKSLRRCYHSKTHGSLYHSFTLEKNIEWGRIFTFRCSILMTQSEPRPYQNNFFDGVRRWPNATPKSKVSPISDCGISSHYSSSKQSSSSPVPKIHSAGYSPDKIRRVALISDIHVFDVDGFWNENILEFFNLRILGLLNILFLRGPERFSVEVLSRAIQDMHAMKIDHLILAGDITNLSLESEFATAHKLIEAFGPPESITAIPGNHDVYNRGELRRQLFQKYFGKYAVSDIPRNSPRGDGFPIIQIRGNIALIGLNTALPGSARGMVGRRQWNVVEQMMEHSSSILKRVGLKILVLHHPAQNPVIRGLPWIREIGHDLKDWKAVAAFCKKYAIDLVVHGHNHVPYQCCLDGSPHTLVCESGSGTLMTYDPERVARYTVFELNEESHIVRLFARVWDMEQKCFQTKEHILPQVEKHKTSPFAAA
eukprot:jgi/Galph1/4878/GphlegSOOS_G3530.1